MAKKRKAGGQPFGQNSNKSLAKESSKLNISTYEDVADSEDEFHIAQDKILLDEAPEAKRRRKWNEQDEFLQPSDEEVLAIEDTSEDEEDDDDLEREEDDDMSDDLGMHNRQDEEEEEEGWGPSKKDYYNNDAIETEQDALDEEAEARRIQQKQLQSMSEADFAFDADEWLGQDIEDAKLAEGDADDVVTEMLPELTINDDMGAEERLRLLKMRYPEFDHLAKEFLDLQPLHDELALAASASENLFRLRKGHNGHIKETRRPPMAVFKYQALAAYLAAIAMYFALLTSTSNIDGTAQPAKSPAELRNHPVMESLVQFRQLWSKVKGLNAADPMVDHSGELSSIEEEDDMDVAVITNSNPGNDMVTDKKPKKPKKTKAQRAAEAAQAEAEARRAEKIRQTQEELAALTSLTDKTALWKISRPKSSKSAVAAGNAEDSDFGDETELTAHELAEKAKKKKSLRFYTSQIAQKAIKRGAAGRDAGGDADIPHRERFRDRQLRLQAEAEKRGQMRKGPGEELGGDSDDDDRRQAQELCGTQEGSDDEYYDMVAARSKQKKSKKEELAAAHALAVREGGRVVETEQIGADGKRKITYQIQKNKGLTPHRKKEVRNPRVKKRMAYDAKKKKLKSQKAVYAGGEGRGGYKGELTGIKSTLVKSVKL